MNIKCFPVKMTREEAMTIAKTGGGLLGKLFVKDKAITLRLMYLENRYLIYQMTYLDSPLATLFRKKKAPDQQKIRVMVEATTCTASYVQDEIKVMEQDIPEEDIQFTYYEEKRLHDCGANMARRLVRRHLGRNLSIKVDTEEKVFRPFYIAIYGDMKEGTRARYLPIEADGNSVKRTF